MSYSIRTGTIIAALAVTMAATLGIAPAYASGDGAELHTPDQGWTFDGVFGRYDAQTLQRGYLVFETVCASCHSLQFVAYRNLADPGGPGFTMDEARAIAAQHQVPAGPNEYGETVDEYGMALTRAGIPADRIPSPFANEISARAANGGTLPPDLSLMTKARLDGPNYIYSLITGYEDAPHPDEMTPGTNYNPYFPGHEIAMAPPLYDDAVEYPDGTTASLEQMAYDVTNFLAWAAEPKLEKRKRMGFQVMAFLLLLAGMTYVSYKRVWGNIKH